MNKFNGTVNLYGTKEDVHRLLRAHLKNAIPAVTLSHKKDLGRKCENPICNHEGELQYAHKKGKERLKIGRLAIEKWIANGSVSMELTSLQRLKKIFLDEHGPLYSSGLFLCQRCHNSYDKGHLPNLEQLLELPWEIRKNLKKN